MRSLARPVPQCDGRTKSCQKCARPGSVPGWPLSAASRNAEWPSGVPSSSMAIAHQWLSSARRVRNASSGGSCGSQPGGANSTYVSKPSSMRARMAGASSGVASRMRTGAVWRPGYDLGRLGLRDRVDVVDQLALDQLGLVVVDLAGAGRLVAAAAVGEHQLADVDLARAVEDRLAHREDGVLLLEAPEHVHREVALREQGVQREAVGGVDDVLVAEVEDHQVTEDRGAALDLRDGQLGVLVVELDALLDVRGLQDLLDGQLGARVDELHHQLVVGDPELAEAPEARARVHEEAEQRPA